MEGESTMKSNWFSISIDDLIREYGHIHGVVIPVSCVFLDYMEIVILTDDGSNTIEAYLRKLKSEIEIVSLNCGITCCIIKKRQISQNYCAAIRGVLCRKQKSSA